MLQIRLSNPESVGGAKSLPAETVTVACPDHLVLADLPVAKSIGATPAASLIKIVGRRCRRHYGERTHFCVRCDFPVAIYGRLSPCEHAFCLDCARSDSSCYLCDERIQKIQTIKMMEGLFICAAPHCLKSFLKKSEFVSHIQQKHVDLLQPNMEKEDGNQSDALTLTRPSSTDALTKQSSTVDVSAARAPPRIGISPNSNSQYHDLEDKSRRNQPREQQLVKSPMVQPKPPPFYSRPPNYPPEMQENNTTPVLDRPGPYNHFHQQHSSDSQGGLLHRQDSNQFPEKMQGMRAESPFPDYSMHSQPPPGFVVPVNTNQGLAPPFNYSPFPAEGAQPFYNPPYEMARPDMASVVGPEQNSLLGYPPPPSGAMGYPRPWNMGPAGMPFEHIPPGQGVLEGYVNQSDSQGRPAFFQGDYGQVPGMLPLQPPLMPPMAGKVLEPPQGGSASDGKGGKGVLAPEPMSLPPPPPPPPHLSQLPPQGNFSHSGEAGQEEQNYRWQNEADRQ